MTTHCPRCHALIAVWTDLSYRGIMEPLIPGEPRLELRNCACGSTLSREIAPPPVLGHTVRRSSRTAMRAVR